jgi:hypothetical protein
MIAITSLRSRLAHLAAKLKRHQSGVAMVEFAMSLPILAGLTFYGAEAANMAYTSQKLGDLATLTADSVSRIRIAVSEGDVTDAMNGIKILGDGIHFRDNGRIIISSVMPVTDPSNVVTDQKIRWQRCSGALSKAAGYGAESASLGTAGIGPAGRKITASADNEVIFVEIYFTYQPLISSSLLGTPQLSALSAMTVRERSSNDLYSSGTASPCSAFTA